jgi:hypothetical protein
VTSYYDELLRSVADLMEVTAGLREASEEERLAVRSFIEAEMRLAGATTAEAAEVAEGMTQAFAALSAAGAALRAAGEGALRATATFNKLAAVLDERGKERADSE